MTVRIWFHGTDRQAAQAISEQGFRADTWLAEHLEDAVEFGGEYVFEVALSHEPVEAGNWQMLVGDAVPASSIVRLTHYKPIILIDHPDRRNDVFKANQNDPAPASAERKP